MTESNYCDIINEKGYVDIEIEQIPNIVEEIKRLKEEKNAIILGHYYLTPELQEISDFLGDSLALAQKAQATDADIIVFMGVHFMAETAKILNPTKKVIIPDMLASCSLAESAPKEKFAAFKAEHPDHKVISYINCSADIKTLSDMIVTSSNALKIVESFPEDQKLIFAPDKNLGGYINSITGRDMVLWDGACIVHEQFSLEKIIELMDSNSDAEFIAHPECEKPVLMVASFVGSTTALLNYAKSSSSKRFIVATENGILHQMKKSCPDKEFIPAPATDSTCGCNDCAYMKLNTLDKLYRALRFEQPELLMDMETINQAKEPILRMLELSK